MPLELDNLPQKILENPDIAIVAIEAQNTSDANKQKSGWLGRLFGVGENATLNYMGTILFLIVISLLFMGFLDFNADKDGDISKYTDVWIPIVTSIIGFIFGKKTS